MYFLVYISSAVHPFSSEELKTLLTQARVNNEKLGITGLLLYKDGNFMQLLEGEQQAVEATQRKILGDPRHRGLITLLKGPAGGRDFTDWSMGFHDLQAPEVRDIPGYTEFLNTSLSDSKFTDLPSNARRLLLMFKQKM